MDDIAPEIYERLKAEYERRRGSAADAAEKAKGYRDVLSWADHAGRSAALTFDGILPEELPGGMMYFNIAERTLRPVLEEVAADVLTVARAAQDALNAAAGIEMAFQAPDEEDKIKGLVDLACAGPWEAQQDDFCAATQTYASKVSDDCIRQNAGSQYDAGMDPKIIRTAGAGACKWCALLAGTYDYEKVRRGSEVFSRHVNCNCVVEYEPRKGRRQNVHTKAWNEESSANQLKAEQMQRSRGIREFARNGKQKVERELTEDEIRFVESEAEALQIPLNVLRFNQGAKTGFLDAEEVIHIRGDIFPDLSSRDNNDLLSVRCTLAHEYYGHFKAHPTTIPVGNWRDEFRASYRAALDTPNLTDEERRMLMIDAFDRPRVAGVPVKMNDIAKRMIYGY